MNLADLTHLEKSFAAAGVPEIRNNRNPTHIETPDRDFFASTATKEHALLLVALWNNAPELFAALRAHLSPPVLHDDAS